MNSTNDIPSRADGPDRWEERYSSTRRLWSNEPNEWLAAVTESWTPGRVLDIGCGEGADLLWLVSRGWEGVGIDYSVTAISRMCETARLEGLRPRLTGIVGDASSVDIDGEFDLICVSFVHCDDEGDGPTLPGLLARQVERLAPGGRLMIAVHAVNPPWHSNHGTTYTAAELLAALSFVTPRWQIEVGEDRWREVPASGEHEAGRRADALLVLRSPASRKDQ